MKSKWGRRNTRGRKSTLERKNMRDRKIWGKYEKFWGGKVSGEKSTGKEKYDKRKKGKTKNMGGRNLCDCRDGIIRLYVLAQCCVPPYNTLPAYPRKAVRVGAVLCPPEARAGRKRWVNEKKSHAGAQ